MRELQMLTSVIQMYLNTRCLGLYGPQISSQSSQNFRQFEKNQPKYSHIHLFIEQINPECL